MTVYIVGEYGPVFATKEMAERYVVVSDIWVEEQNGPDRRPFIHEQDVVESLPEEGIIYRLTGSIFESSKTDEKPVVVMSGVEKIPYFKGGELYCSHDRVGKGLQIEHLKKGNVPFGCGLFYTTTETEFSVEEKDHLSTIVDRLNEWFKGREYVLLKKNEYEESLLIDKIADDICVKNRGILKCEG